MWFLSAVESHEFAGPQSFSELEKIVRRTLNTTSLVRIERAEDCLIGVQSGRTQSGLRFNVPAFQQLTGQLVGGLYSVMAKIWSDGTVPEDKKRHYIMEVYRAALGSLGKELIGQRFVVDTGRQEIVGVVGRKYKFVSNAEILSSLSRYFNPGGQQNNYRAIRATLRNRDIMLVACSRQASRRVDSIEFHQGVAIYNSETTRQAIYAPQLVFDTVSKTYCMQTQQSSNRMIHRAKKNFPIFLEELIQGAFRHSSILDTVVDGYGRLSKQVLYDRGQRPAILAKLQKNFKDRDIGAWAIGNIVKILTSIDNATNWDLYRSLVTTASQTTLSDRILRWTAYRMLVKT